MSLISELHFWTLTDDILIKDDDIGCYKLHDKNVEVQQQEHSYRTEKESYTISRGIKWTPRNKRPDKVRESLKEFENILSSQKCVGVIWMNSSVIHFIFNKGVLVFLQVNTNPVNIERIGFDRYLVGKLTSDNITDVLMDESKILIAFAEAKLVYLYFGKKQSSSDRWEKISSLDPRLMTITLVGPVNRKFDRRLSLNTTRDWLLIWWPTRSFDLWPWMPLTSDRERANAVIYALTNSSVELLSYAKTEGELVSACFSKQYPFQVLTVEEHISKNDQISVNVCTYHVAKGRFQQVAVTTIPLQGHVSCCQWSVQEDHLLIACSDMSVIIFDKHREITKLTTALFVPIEMAWHKEGTIVVLASEKGQLQCLDIALSLIKMQLLSDDLHPIKKLDLSTYFRKKPALFRLLWDPAGGKTACNSLCLIFDMGPVALLDVCSGTITKGVISPSELVSQYLKTGLIDEAVALLKSLNWGFQTEACYYCLMVIINFLLRQPLNRVIEEQIQIALGTFYELEHPLPETVITEYRDRVGRLARRFFHQLLRHEQLEKAFLLAVDLGCRDLFLDLHHIAISKGEPTLANVALQKADQLNDACSMTSASYEESTEDENSDLSDDQVSVREDLLQPSPLSRNSGRKSTKELGNFLVTLQEGNQFDTLTTSLHKINAPKKCETVVVPSELSVKNGTSPSSAHYSHFRTKLQDICVTEDQFATQSQGQRSQNITPPPPLPPRLHEGHILLDNIQPPVLPAKNRTHDSNRAGKVRQSSLPGQNRAVTPEKHNFQDYSKQATHIPLRTLSMMHQNELLGNFTSATGDDSGEIVHAKHVVVNDTEEEDTMLQDGSVQCVHFGIV